MPGLLWLARLLPAAPRRRAWPRNPPPQAWFGASTLTRAAAGFAETQERLGAAHGMVLGEVGGSRKAGQQKPEAMARLTKMGNGTLRALRRAGVLAGKQAAPPPPSLRLPCVAEAQPPAPTGSADAAARAAVVAS